jgi:hypothetical protein
VHIGFFGGGTGRKRALGRPKPRREDNIKADLKEMEGLRLDWSGSR